MGAIFYKFSDNQMFKNSVGSGGLAVCSALDTFNEEASNISIITNVGFHVAETIQFFQSFDDLVHFFYFGKGLGSVTFNMLLFLGCDSSEAPGLNKLLESLGNMRGKETEMHLGNIAFTGVLTDFSITVESEPETHYLATINLAMINHQMPSSAKASTSC